jgi:hypothetical protein
MIHLSQPALSLQIRALEDEIGVRLFERNRRKTALTAAGIAFREEATGALLRLDQAVDKAKLAAKGKLGILRIGFISTAGNEIVPTIIRQSCVPPASRRASRASTLLRQSRDKHRRYRTQKRRAENGEIWWQVSRVANASAVIACSSVRAFVLPLVITKTRVSVGSSGFAVPLAARRAEEVAG